MRTQWKSLLFLGIGIMALMFTSSLTSCKKGDSPGPSSQPTAKVYVADEGGASLSVVNANSNEKIATIYLLDDDGQMMMPHNVQVAPDGKTVWATGLPMVGCDYEGSGNELVFVIDPQTNSVLKKISLGIGLHIAHVVLDAQSNFAYVTAYEGNVVIQIDARNFTETKRFDIGAGRKPHGIREKDGKLYVANMDGKSMSIIDVASGSINEVALGGVAVQTAVTKDGMYAFASLYDTKEVVRYDIHTGAIQRTPLPAEAQGPIQLYPTPDNRLLYVCDQGALQGRPTSNRVYVMDIATGNIVQTIMAGKKVHGVVVSNDGKYAYVTNTIDNTISIIDIASQKVIKTVTVGSTPNGISYWYSNGGMP